MRGTGDQYMSPTAEWRWWHANTVPGIGVLVTWWAPDGSIYRQFFPYW